jgi:hypothetical protein
MVRPDDSNRRAAAISAHPATDRFLEVTLARSAGPGDRHVDVTLAARRRLHPLTSACIGAGHRCC